MPNVKPYNYQQIHDRRLAESICVAAVVSVTAFDPAKMTVDVQPLSKHLQNGKYESVGVVLYLDHDMDSTVSGGKEAQPLTERNHATTDAVFIGGIVAGSYTVQGLPSEALVLAADDGSVYVAVTKGGVQIKGDVHVEGQITASKDIVAEERVSGAHHTHPGDSGGMTGQPI